MKSLTSFCFLDAFSLVILIRLYSVLCQTPAAQQDVVALWQNENKTNQPRETFRVYSCWSYTNFFQTRKGRSVVEIPLLPIRIFFYYSPYSFPVLAFYFLAGESMLLSLLVALETNQGLFEEKSQKEVKVEYYAISGEVATQDDFSKYMFSFSRCNLFIIFQEGLSV